MFLNILLAKHHLLAFKLYKSVRHFEELEGFITFEPIGGMNG
jgi:hypothetical protein